MLDSLCRSIWTCFDACRKLGDPEARAWPRQHFERSVPSLPSFKAHDQLCAMSANTDSQEGCGKQWADEVPSLFVRDRKSVV